MRKTAVVLLVFLFLTAVESIAIRIRVDGNWSRIIDAGDLLGAPGSDLNPSYESATNQVMIDIQNTRTNWSVDVKRVDTNWHSDIHLYVRRTSNGSGPGSVSDGISYQEATEADQTFFSGYRQRQNIYIQLRMDGISVRIPPDTYTTTIYYTIYEWQ